ncbi:SUMF1/EgtB/PvdO family nonheme iron enzyme [Dryocola sp. BD626]|uniref:SUMF1/EgtB/PvdO family nonheme iron enzyme n=1 Tax=Dryocola sp. BD626 TaxID=3133273 RepID=UPI003F4FA545
MALSKEKWLIISFILLTACDDNSGVLHYVANNPVNELNSYIKEIKSELVFVEGGTFLMGDYGEEYGPEHLPYDSNQDSKTLHKVVLSGFSISKFKVTNEVYKNILILSIRKVE